MADILVSHINEDHNRIKSLVGLLEEHQWTVWWNEKAQPGEAIDTATETQLEDAKIIITAWSEKSVLSRLVRNTAFEAIESNRWLPLRFDSVKVPLRYRHYQTLDVDEPPQQGHPDIEASLVQRCRAILVAQDFERASTEVAPAKGSLRSQPSNRVEKKISKRNPLPANQREEVAGIVLYSTVQLGDWVVEEGQNRIICGARTKRITPRSMQVLMLLVENAGSPVSIERILSHVWRDRVVVESVVHRCIKELRDAFEDKFKEPRYIETIAKRGYRIVAPMLSET